MKALRYISDSKCFLRWGIIGAGFIADIFVNDLEKYGSGNSVIGSVIDTNLEKAQSFGQKHQLDNKFCFDKFDDFALSGINVVYVAPPNSHHVNYAIKCLESGLHVLIEKPMAMDEKGAKAVFDAARSNNKFAMEGLFSRFIPAMQEINNKLIDEEIIGKINHIDVNCGFDAINGAKKFLLNRLINKELGGGSLYDLGSYPLNLAMHLFKNRHPKIKYAIKTLNENNIDLKFNGILSYSDSDSDIMNKNDAILNFRTSIIKDTANTAIISGDKGYCIIDTPFHHPISFSINGERFEFERKGYGLHYEVDEVENCISQNLIESSRMPWEESISMAKTLEDLNKNSVSDEDSLHPNYIAEHITVPSFSKSLVVQIGIIGCGRIGKVHAKTVSKVSEKANLAWVSDIATTVSNVVADEYKTNTIKIEELDDVLSLPPGSLNYVDGVIICVPTSMHIEYTSLCLKKAKQVFCEKPMHTNPEKIEEMFNLTDEYGGSLRVGYQRVYDKDISRLIEKSQNLCKNNKYPQSISIRCYDSPTAPSSYLKQCGPIYLDMMCHDFHVLASLLHPDDWIESATAHDKLFTDNDLGEQSAIVSLLTKKGTFATIEAHRISQMGYDNTIDVAFDNELIRLHSRPRFAVTSAMGNGNIISTDYDYGFINKYHDAYINTIEDFIDEIANGQKSNNAHKKCVIHATWMMKLAADAAKSGRKMFLETYK